MEQCPEELQERVHILSGRMKKFKKLRKSGDFVVAQGNLRRAPFVRKWFKNENVIVMVLTTGAIQVLIKYLVLIMVFPFTFLLRSFVT